MGDGIKLTLVLLTSRCSGWFTPATVAFDISIVTRSQVLIQLYFSNFKLYSELYFESVRFFIIKYTVRHCYLVLVLVCVLLFVWDCTHAPFCSHVYLIVSEVAQMLMTFGKWYTKQMNTKSVKKSFPQTIPLNRLTFVNWLTLTSAISYVALTRQGFLTPLLKAQFRQIVDRWRGCSVMAWK